MTVHDLPAVNASLNAIAGVLLLVGYVLVRSGRVAQHRRLMIAAFVTSTLFLTCYLVYHAQWDGPSRTLFRRSHHNTLSRGAAPQCRRSRS